MPNQTIKSSTLQIESQTDKSRSIVNDCGTGIVIISVRNDQSDALLYEQSMQQLITTDGKKVISREAKRTVSFDGKSNVLIVAKAGNLFPVKILYPETQTAASVNVSAAGVNNMQPAEKFNRTITAFPSSSLPQDYATALYDDDLTPVEAFFKASKEYKSLTLDMVIAVDTYYKVYPFRSFSAGPGHFKNSYTSFFLHNF